jgi:hypothetical protein
MTAFLLVAVTVLAVTGVVAQEEPGPVVIESPDQARINFVEPSLPTILTSPSRSRS